MTFKDRLQMIGYLPRGGNVAELGVFLGDFSQQLLTTVQPETLYLIDAWKYYDYGYADPLNVSQEWHDGNCRSVMARFAEQIAEGKVFVMRMLTTLAAAQLPDDFFSLVYVDANHSYQGTLDDLRAFAPKVRKGGYLLGHDYTYNLGFGVIPAVTEFCTSEGWELEALTDEEWPSYMLRRKS